MTTNATFTYTCDKCGKTAPSEPPSEGEMGGAAPTGWHNITARNMRTLETKVADLCETCTATVLPDFLQSLKLPTTQSTTQPTGTTS